MTSKKDEQLCLFSSSLSNGGATKISSIRPIDQNICLSLQHLITTSTDTRDHFGHSAHCASLYKEPVNLISESKRRIILLHLYLEFVHFRRCPHPVSTITSKTSNRSLLSAKLAASSSHSKVPRSGSLPPSRHSISASPSPNTSFNSSSSTANLTRSELYARDLYNKMSYVLVSTDDFHRGPTRISTIDPYLHEKMPFTVIKDSLYFQAEPQYDPHGRFWKFRVEDAPVRVLNKLLDLGYKVLTGTSVAGSFEHKQPGHAWTLFRDPNVKFSLFNSH